MVYFKYKTYTNVLGGLTFFRCFINQLSESEESEGEAGSTTENKAAPSSGRKYVPPKIAPVHYGNALRLFKHFFFVSLP